MKWALIVIVQVISSAMLACSSPISSEHIGQQASASYNAPAEQVWDSVGAPGENPNITSYTGILATWIAPIVTNANQLLNYRTFLIGPNCGRSSTASALWGFLVYEQGAWYAYVYDQYNNVTSNFVNVSVGDAVTIDIFQQSLGGPTWILRAVNTTKNTSTQITDQIPTDCRYITASGAEFDGAFTACSQLPIYSPVTHMEISDQNFTWHGYGHPDPYVSIQKFVADWLINDYCPRASIVQQAGGATAVFYQNLH